MKSKADRSEPSSHRSRRSSAGPGPSVLSSRSSVSKRGSFALRLLRVAAPSTRSSCRASHRRRHLLSSSGEMHGHASSHGSTLVYFISCWDASGRSTAMVQRARGTQKKVHTPYLIRTSLYDQAIWRTLIGRTSPNSLAIWRALTRCTSPSDRAIWRALIRRTSPSDRAIWRLPKCVCRLP